MARRTLRVLTVASLLAFGATTLACGLGGGPVTPTKPREEVDDLIYKVPKAFQGMDLPWYGGLISQSSGRTMTISYLSTLNVTAEQLRTWWPEALEAEGWIEQSRSLTGNGTLLTTYRTPEGRGAFLTVRPEGTIWAVILSINPPPEPEPAAPADTDTP